MSLRSTCLCMLLCEAALSRLHYCRHFWSGIYQESLLYATPVWKQIDGEPVLKANNYDLESGEQSIFDVELNRAPQHSLLLSDCRFGGSQLEGTFSCATSHAYRFKTASSSPSM